MDTIAAINELFDEYTTQEYEALYEERSHWLRDAFKNYRSADPLVQTWLKRLVERHTRMCYTTEDRRRHNAFVMVFMAGLTAREVARRQSIAQSMVWRDVKRVLGDMMLLVFGVDGVKPRSMSKMKSSEKI